MIEAVTGREHGWIGARLPIPYCPVMTAPMGSLTLSLSNAQVIWRVGDGALLSGAGWTISWRVRFNRWAKVEVSEGGGDLGKMRGSLTMSAGTIEPQPDRPEDKDALSFERCKTPIGHVAFLPATEESEDGVFGAEPDGYEIRLIVPEAEFQAMIGRVLADQVPHSLRLNVPDFKYGWAPDGSHQTWDMAEHPYARTDAATFIFGWDMQADDTEEAEERPLLAPIEPKPSAEAQALAALTVQVSRFGNYVLLILAAIFVLLAARLW